jgi:hypothetical protein
MHANTPAQQCLMISTADETCPEGWSDNLRWADPASADKVRIGFYKFKSVDMVAATLVTRLRKTVGVWNMDCGQNRQGVCMWLTLDMGGRSTVFGVSTRGHGYQGNTWWTTRYLVYTSIDGLEWDPIDGTLEMMNIARGIELLDRHLGTNMAFEGNSDQNTRVDNYFDKPKIARYVRVMPITYNKQPGMRVGLLCDACSDKFKESPQCVRYDLGPDVCKDTNHPSHKWFISNCWRTCSEACLVKDIGCPYDLYENIDDARCATPEWSGACTNVTHAHFEAAQQLCKIQCDPACNPSTVHRSYSAPSLVPTGFLAVGHRNCKEKYTIYSEPGDTKNRGTGKSVAVAVCGECESRSFALSPAFVVGYKVLGVCKPLQEHSLYVEESKKCEDADGKSCADLMPLKCQEFLGRNPITGQVNGEYEDQDALTNDGVPVPCPRPGSSCNFATPEDQAFSIEKEEGKPMAFTCGRVYATIEVDQAAKWDKTTGVAYGNMYRLVQGAVAECHSSSETVPGQMACANHKEVKSCHMRTVQIGNFTSQSLANAHLKKAASEVLANVCTDSIPCKACTKRQQRKLTSVRV